MIEELEKLDELEAYKGKWQNLWFLFSGESTRGAFTYNSRDAALEQGKSWFRPYKPRNMVLIDENTSTLGRWVYSKEVSHFIPMPIGEE